MVQSNTFRAHKSTSSALRAEQPVSRPPLRLVNAGTRTAAAQQSPRSVPPDEKTVRKLALIAYEVMIGLRPIAQLSMWASSAVLQTLTLRRQLHASKQAMYKTQRVILSPGRAHMKSPCRGTLEATVVLHGIHRSCAVALRFELLDDRWRASEITVL